MQRSCLKVDHAAREMIAVFSVAFSSLVTVVGQIIKTRPPIQCKVPEYISGHPAYISLTIECGNIPYASPQLQDAIDV